MPNVDDVVQAVCRLPLDFHATRTMSAVDLVRASGYPAVRSEVTVERLATCLRDHPDWVEQWFEWSADNRGSPAWYLLVSGSGEFQLGFYEGPDSQPPVTLTDKVHAAAEFVHRYLEQVAELPVPS